MFDDFIGGVSEFYDSVDGLFKDLTGGKDILDLVKTGAKAYDSSATQSAASAVKPSYDTSVDVTGAAELSGAMSDIRRSVSDTKAIVSEDPADIMNDWYKRIYQIATGESNGF